MDEIIHNMYKMRRGKGGGEGVTGGILTQRGYDCNVPKQGAITGKEEAGKFANHWSLD